MRYELMLPHQIRRAIAENWPVVLPLGVLEYHGEHMALGMDTLPAAPMWEQVTSLIRTTLAHSGIDVRAGCIESERLGRGLVRGPVA